MSESIPTLKINGLWTQFVEPLRNRTQFKTHGALYGVPGEPRTIGRLPAEFLDSVTQADYVVYSYDTPIAWHIPDAGWRMPPVNYSQSTSKQQGRINTALCAIEEEESRDD